MPAFQLFDFQSEVADQLATAAQDWIEAYATHGALRDGRTDVPFIGHLKAITGAGKTPILASVCGQLGPSLVLWTSKSSAVVEQTYRNLCGRYHGLLGSGSIQILRERPAKAEWRDLISATQGMTIWVTTVSSWNERDAAEEGGSETARLNMHRPHQDWGGPKSPWEQLRTARRRPVWIVYDESHNQTPTQLDQLVGLGPLGFLLASATPPESEMFSRFETLAEQDEIMAPIASRGKAVVSTIDVVNAQLLKDTLEVSDYQTEPEPMLDAVIIQHKRLQRAAGKESAAFNPKSIYVVERSNPRAGSHETPRPIAIWQYLRQHGIPSDQIAIYTDTKARYVPEDAEKIASITALEDRHRHIIFNRGLQEGWDDPEVYLCYFDDETHSYVRIQQIVGRVLRQPGARHASHPALNTATLFIRVRNDRYDEIVGQIKRDLSQYDAEGDESVIHAVRLRTKKERLTPIAVKSKYRNKLSLKTYVLGQADLSKEEKRIRRQATRPWQDEDLLSPGVLRNLTISLLGNEDKVKYAQVASRVRVNNGLVLRKKLDQLNRWCSFQVEPEWMIGPAFEQRSSAGSPAQEDLAGLARSTVEAYESSVAFEDNEIDGERQWTLGEHQPPSGELVPFKNAAHPKYSRADFNKPEFEFAEALNSFDECVWARNPARRPGYGLPLPVKVGGSSTFYPDFLWWVGRTCFAIDPTGRHILEAKVRGKLLTLAEPVIVLATPGKVESDWSRISDSDGWTMVRSRLGATAMPEYFESAQELLTRLKESASPTKLRRERK